jgi:arylsulfatase A-like enzyme
MRTHVKIAVVVAAFGATIAFAEKPNVLFIAIDDCKPVFGCYGDTFVQSPNIDALAERGTVFLNNHCQWAVCGPSRASLMSGMMPETTGVMGFKPMRGKLSDLVALPQHFRENGYETAATGKINDYRCVDGGREGDDTLSWSVPYDWGVKKPYRSAKKKQSVEASVRDEAEHDDTQICETGIELMNQLAEGDKPFFLGVGFKKPHLPFIAPVKYWDLYDRDDVPMPEFVQKPKNGLSNAWNNSKETRGYADVPKTGDIPEEKQRELIHGYYACVSFIDSLIGRLLENLERLELAENTIVVIWGDHGFHLGDHDEWGKHTNMEQATRSPLIIAAPGMLKSNKTKNPSGFIDVYPTLCDLAGLSVPEAVQGKSLTPMLQDSGAKVRNGAISIFRRGAMGYAYRTDRVRYIEWIKGGEVIGRELYDYENDPLETVNLAADERIRPLLDRLAEQMREEGVGCNMLLKTGK